MYAFTTILATASLAITALATPNGGYGGWGSGKRPSWWNGRGAVCMSDNDAQTVANHFNELISNYSNSSANAYLTADFQDYSDSVSELINSGCTSGPATLGAATFTNRDAFEAGQGSQPNIPFKQLNVRHNCDTVTLRWMTTVQAGAPQAVRGIIVLETVYENRKWLIKTVYSEFNSGAWLVDLGVFKPANCPA
ncbi:uncharacterized protein MYCFIDRAFT_181415 [Pseudocercospora fijiensis CIRAD86]|uniref:NTF2-like domain-containing protein n=1 Tax=Pseudocercospora fijiensis (strain CIRAD86) TaxID=383855 RepID=N1Q872_PSEFD|nr:uncharacterized protein MYCFIDRAFT_181415 [Pseudocercospora fijiensis CIRAD86]EME89034.1 hypothetical protein MYCFIDRAFT_181415 [Pseudocercospora fijiensis CIRAD86]